MLTILVLKSHKVIYENHLYFLNYHAKLYPMVTSSTVYNLGLIREFHAINFQADTNVKKNQSNSQQSRYIY